MVDEGSSLRVDKTLIEGVPAAQFHAGCRVKFGPDGKLYITTGDATQKTLAQNTISLAGKILRINSDGSIPSDNPFPNSPIWSYGHRNPQGLAFSASGKLYSSEHGPDTDDEFNLVEAGKNYGWPRVAGYNDDKVYVYSSWPESNGVACASMPFSQTVIPPSVPQRKESTWSSPDFKAPLRTFFTMGNDYDVAKQGSATNAPGGLEIYPANGPIPNWGNSALVLIMKSGQVYRVKLTADGAAAVGEPTPHLKSTNRYRDVAISPDGRTIYLATDSQGSSTDAQGRTVRTLANPGAIVAFTYTP
jgi:PQQ-dependent dehydrogenase (s-GDH family)